MPVGCDVVVVVPAFVLAVVVFGAAVVLDGVVVVLAAPGVVLPVVGVDDAGKSDGVTASPGFGSGLDVMLASSSLRPVSFPLFRYL